MKHPTTYDLSLGERDATLHLVDGALGGQEVDGVGRRHVEGLGFAIEAGALAGHAEAVLAGGDDLRDELFAVHADLHGDPVLGELLGQLQLVLRAALFAAAAAAVLGQPEGGEEQLKHRLKVC